MRLPIIAILLGIEINYLSGGLPFSTFLCIFGGIFIMMPAFLSIEYADIQSLKNKKNIIIKSLLSNAVFLPMIATLIGVTIFHNNISLLFGIIFLSLLSGGGLMMSRIHKTKGDSKTGLWLFILNMIVFIGIFFVFEYVVQHIGTPLMQGLTCSSQTISCIGNGNISPINGIVILIIAPFLVSRGIRLFKKTSQRIQKYIGIISQIATFIIISYIFALEHMQSIFQTPITTILLAMGGLLFFYSITIGIHYFLRIRKNTNKEDIAGFWMGISRFITMGFVFSFLYTQTFGSDFMIIFILAYLIQIPASLIATKYIIKKTQ